MHKRDRNTQNDRFDKFKHQRNNFCDVCRFMGEGQCKTHNGSSPNYRGSGYRHSNYAQWFKEYQRLNQKTE